MSRVKYDRNNKGARRQARVIELRYRGSEKSVSTFYGGSKIKWMGGGGGGIQLNRFTKVVMDWFQS